MTTNRSSFLCFKEGYKDTEKNNDNNNKNKRIVQNWQESKALGLQTSKHLRSYGRSLCAVNIRGWFSIESCLAKMCSWFRFEVDHTLTNFTQTISLQKVAANA